MLRFFLRRRARRLDQYWQALSGHDAPPQPPPPGLPADLAEQTRWLHSVSQAISPAPAPPTSASEQPPASTPPPPRPAAVTPRASGASTGSLLLAVLIVSGLIVAATRVTAGSRAQRDQLPTITADANNPILGASFPPEVRDAINAMVTHVTISDTAQAIDLAITANAVWVATTADRETEAASTALQALLFRVPFDTFTGVEFYAGTPTATLRPNPPIVFAGDIARILAAYGSLWVAGVSQTGEGRLLRMDPDSGAILTDLRLDTWPGDLVATDGAVWVGGHLAPRIWRVSSDGTEMQSIDVADPSAGLAHIPATTPGELGLWYLPHADVTDGRPAIRFAHLVGNHAIDPTRSDATTCAPVGSAHDGVSDAERDRPLAFTECRLWVVDGFSIVSIYPPDVGAQPEQTLEFDGHVDQILPDGEHVHVLVAELASGMSADTMLYRFGPDGEREQEALAEGMYGTLAYAGQVDRRSPQHWLWMVTGRSRGGVELVARPRPEPPALPPDVPPTPAAGFPAWTPTPLGTP